MNNKKNRIIFNRTALVASLALSLILSFGCGGATTPKEPPAPPPPPVDEDLLSLAPSQANAAVWIDMVELRKSKLFEALETFLGEEEIPFWGETETVNPLRQSEEILFVFANGIQDEPDQLLVLIKGSFNTEHIIAETLKEPESKKESVESFLLVRTKKTLVLAPTDRTVAIGTEALVRQVAKLAAKRGKCLRDVPEFADLSLDGPKTLHFRYKQGAVAPNLNRLGTKAPAIDMDSIVSMNAEIGTGVGFDLEIEIVTPTQLGASGLARELNDLRSEIAKNMFVALLGVDWILDKMVVSSEKTSVSISLRLDARDLEEINKLAARLRKIRELADGQPEPLQVPENQPLRKLEKKEEHTN